MARLPVKPAVSAGGVVWREGEQGIEVLLVGRSEFGTWGLPKGTPHAGESVEDAALREVSEETGLQTEIEASLGSVRYWFTRVSEGFRFDKTVHYFLMRPIGGDISRHDWEYDQVRWFGVDTAKMAMTYKNEIMILKQAVEFISRRLVGLTNPSNEEKESHAA